MFHSVPFDLLIQVSATQFSLFFQRILSCVMATDRTFEDAMRTPLPASPTPLSSNLGSPNGSVPDLERIGSLPSTWRDEINETAAQLAQLPLFLQSVSRVENCVQTHTQTVAAIKTKVTSIEQMVGSLAARVAALETGAASASSASGSARSWNILGQSDGSSATGSHGPGSSDDNRNT